MRRGSVEVANQIGRSLRGKIESFSIHQYASNFIESCLKRSDATGLYANLYQELSVPSVTARLMKDKYGIFVLVQAILAFRDIKQSGIIVNVLRIYDLAKSTSKGNTLSLSQITFL